MDRGQILTGDTHIPPCDYCSVDAPEMVHRSFVSLLQRQHASWSRWVLTGHSRYLKMPCCIGLQALLHHGSILLRLLHICNRSLQHFKYSSDLHSHLELWQDPPAEGGIIKTPVLMRINPGSFYPWSDSRRWLCCILSIDLQTAFLVQLSCMAFVQYRQLSCY